MIDRTNTQIDVAETPHHKSELDRLTKMGCSTDDDNAPETPSDLDEVCGRDEGRSWLHLLVADDGIAEGHHMALCGVVFARSELPSSLCADDCKRDHVYCLACIRVANEHNWNAGVDTDCPPGVIVRTAR